LTNELTQFRIVQDLAGVERPVSWVFGRRQLPPSLSIPKGIVGLCGSGFIVRGSGGGERYCGLKYEGRVASGGSPEFSPTMG